MTDSEMTGSSVDADPVSRESRDLGSGSGIESGVDYALDPRSILVARLTGLIVTAALAALSLPIALSVLLGLGGLAEDWPVGHLLVPLVWLLMVALLLARAWAWPALRYRHTSYRVDPRSLVIRRGVLWRSVTFVPRSRVQHTDVSQGPIERQFELGTLVVHTAGTQFAAVPLSGLAYRTAIEIRDLLIDENDGDGV